MDSNQAKEFFKTGFLNNNKRLSALVKFADHEFNSQVTMDEATGKWKVVKKVEEESSFDSEQEAIEWSTQPIGTRAPKQAAPEPQDMERTPLKEPISTDEQNVAEKPEGESSELVGGSLFGDQEPAQEQKTEQPEKRPDNYQEASSFEPVAAINDRKLTAEQKEAMMLEGIARNLRQSGNDQLASKINQLKDEQYFKTATKDLAKVYAKACSDSVRSNRYASSNIYNSTMSTLKSEYGLTQQEAINLLKEVNFPEKFVPNYFE